MLALRVIGQLPLMALGPLTCRLRGHRWHVFPMHACTPVRVCVRCSFIVTDPLSRRTT